MEIDGHFTKRRQEKHVMEVRIKTPPINHRVAEVAREHGWRPPESLDSDKNFKPEHTLFCRKLRFVAICALFGEKRVPF